MSRKETIQTMDCLLATCKTCTKRNDPKWGNPSYNRLQQYCNSKCKTGKDLLKVATALDKEVRARRRKKKVSA